MPRLVPLCAAALVSAIGLVSATGAVSATATVSAGAAVSANGAAAGGPPDVLTTPVRVAATSDGAVGYRELGSGPPLLLVTGFGATMDDWTSSFVDGLAEHHRVVIFDNAGVGKTAALAPLTITAMDAHVRVDTADASTVLAPWQTLVTPASANELELIPGGEEHVRALVVRPEPSLDALRQRAVAAGCAPADVDAFFAQF